MHFILYVFMLVGNEYNWVPNGEYEDAILCEMAGNELYRKVRYKCLRNRY